MDTIDFQSVNKRTQQLAIILSTLSAVLTVTQGVDTCSISLSDQMQMASLICNFSENVYETRSNFSVYRHTHHNQTTVLLGCFARNSRFYCTKEVGVAHSQEITNNISVDIPRWIMKESSMFWCSGGNSNQDRIVPCTMNNSAPVIPPGSPFSISRTSHSSFTATLPTSSSTNRINTDAEQNIKSTGHLLTAPAVVTGVKTCLCPNEV